LNKHDVPDGLECGDSAGEVAVENHMSQINHNKYI